MKIKLDTKNFTSVELGMIFELARRALSDADNYEDFANAYDLSDEQVKELQDNIHKCTKGV
jgi:hypothetical protein